MMTLNKLFRLHYQLKQNTGCKVKFVINVNRPYRIIVIIVEVSSHAEILLAPSLPLSYPANDAGLPFGELSQVYPGVTGFKKLLF